LKAFVREFEKRALYYPGTLVMHNQNMIGKKVTAVEDRISDLSTDNMNLSFLYYSKRKENAKLLDAIKEEFEIIKAELSTSSTTVVMGEKLNLYQDVMMTLTRTNRQLDIVESNIGGSKHTKRVVEQYLPSPVSP